MLRDIPRIYIYLFLTVIILVLISVWYRGQFEQDTDTLQLNEVLLSNVVSEVDQTSRLYEGTLLLANTFEQAIWEKIQDKYPTGSIVQFDYVFDSDDSRFHDVPSGVVSSVPYKIGTDDKPDAENQTQTDVFTNKPVKKVKVKVKEANEKLKDWTYTSTIEVKSLRNS